MSTKSALCKHLAVLECVQEINEKHYKEIMKREDETDLPIVKRKVESIVTDM